jgi:hypothetical protein
MQPQARHHCEHSFTAATPHTYIHAKVYVLRSLKVCSSFQDGEFKAVLSVPPILLV